MKLITEYKSWNKYLKRYFWFDSFMWAFFFLYIVFLVNQVYYETDSSMQLGKIIGGLIVIACWYGTKLYVRRSTQRRIDEDKNIQE